MTRSAPWQVEVLLPTLRFVYSLADDGFEVLSEHRSPEAFAAYAELRRRRPVTAMMTFPNTVLVRGPQTGIVDPGGDLQNEPLLRALEVRGIAVDDLDFVALTHAHDDHAAALTQLPQVPLVVHEHETEAANWPPPGVGRRELRLLRGSRGQLAPGLEWALTSGHTAGSISLAVTTADGVVVLCGDTIGPQRQAFEAGRPDGPAAAEIARSWEIIRGWRPTTIIAGHVPPFAPSAGADSRAC